MENLRQINREGRLNEIDPCKNCFVISSYEWRKMTEDEMAARAAKGETMPSIETLSKAAFTEPASTRVMGGP